MSSSPISWALYNLYVLIHSLLHQRGWWLPQKLTYELIFLFFSRIYVQFYNLFYQSMLNKAGREFTYLYQFQNKRLHKKEKTCSKKKSEGLAGGIQSLQIAWRPFGDILETFKKCILHVKKALRKGERLLNSRIKQIIKARRHPSESQFFFKGRVACFGKMMPLRQSQCIKLQPLTWPLNVNALTMQ